MPSHLSFSGEDSPFFSLCNQCWLQDFGWAPSTYQKITVLKALSPRVLHFLCMFIRALLPGTPWTLLLVSTAQRAAKSPFYLLGLCFHSPPKKASNTGKSLQKKSFMCLMTLKSNLITPAMQDYKNTTTNNKTLLVSMTSNWSCLLGKSQDSQPLDGSQNQECH